MRTTINIDEDLLQAAKSLAQARSTSLGAVVSELMRKALQSERQPIYSKQSGFPVFAISENAQPITLEQVKKAEDEL